MLQTKPLFLQMQKLRIAWKKVPTKIHQKYFCKRISKDTLKCCNFSGNDSIRNSHKIFSNFLI